jgi:hypothetical protein
MEILFMVDLTCRTRIPIEGTAVGAAVQTGKDLVLSSQQNIIFGLSEQRSASFT